MRLQILVLNLLAIAVTAPTFAGETNSSGKKKGGHCGVFCPHCGEACYPTVTKGKEKKHYFEVEAKTICIPKVRFPWQTGANGKAGGKDRCPTQNCGRTKTVHVLVKHEYECSVCEYSWDPDHLKNGGGKDKYQSGAIPAVNGSEVAPPPPIAPAEARQQLQFRRPAPLPVRYDLPSTDTTTVTPRKKLSAEALTSFFK